ncbi:MAG: ABC transporter ATP-binding protein [Verrucomicrobia bacterium]|nr:ABC transporter ATP-binding protein [Verrucomicrobiota bacterium]
MTTTNPDRPHTAAATRRDEAPPILAVRNLSVDLPTHGQRIPVVTDVTFRVNPGQAVALVGESGCGKSMTARAIVGLPPSGAHVEGAIVLEGREITALPARQRRRLCGSRIGFIFQEPMTSLHPTLTIGTQICDALRTHLGLSRAAARRRAAELLDRVGIPPRRQTLDGYVHQLSGGMRQRVMIAMAICCGPALVIADEPTTALDVTIQAQVLDLLARMRSELGLAMLYITHDLEVVAEFCDRVLVMYAGDIIEEGPASDTLRRPRHRYTRGLLQAIPVSGDPPPRPVPIPGQVPSLGAWPGGCRFAPRCPRADGECVRHPQLAPLGHGAVRCWHPLLEETESTTHG